MADSIKLADMVSFPAAAAAVQTFAFLARRGAGKTYAAGVLVEGLLSGHQQVVVIDAVGSWAGLRLAKNGRDAGFDIPILGGELGDVGLTPASASLVADTLVDTGTSAVLDVTGFSKTKRKEFVTAFVERLFERKKRAKSPLHVVLEEARLYAPQRLQRGEERMLGAIEDLVRLGRNYGIGVTLIDQRPQSINKDVLNQVECLVVLQTNGTQERKAIADWVTQNAGDAAIDIIDELPSLEIGEGLVWSPQWLKCFKRVRISSKRTFDSSATPTKTEKNVAATAPLPAAALEKLRKAMESAEKETEQNDPRRLRARIAELEKAAKGLAPKTSSTAVAHHDPRVAELAKRLEAALLELNAERALTKTLKARIVEVRGKLNALGVYVKSAHETLDQAFPPLAPPAKPLAEGMVKLPRVMPDPKKAAAILASSGTERPDLRAGARRMLAALVGYPFPLSRTQVATLAGMSPTGGSFSSYLSDLRVRGLIVEGNAGVDKLEPTAEGRALMPSAAPSSPEDLWALWSSKLRKGEREMLRALIDEGPMSRTGLAEVAGYEISGGSFSSYLSTLRTNGLITEERGGNISASTLFTTGASA